MGPLAAAAFESGMSAVEELKLLKAQVQDVARVCNAVARGDLSQKITVPVQGVVMVQLKDVINTMVCVFFLFFLMWWLMMDRLINWDSLLRKLRVFRRRLGRRGMSLSVLSVMLLPCLFRFVFHGSFYVPLLSSPPPMTNN